MDMPEIQYQPGQIGTSFNPVTPVDTTNAIRQEQQRTQQQMNENLQQLQRNNAVELQNAKNKAFPVEELAQFSKTLQGFLGDRLEEHKEDMEAEATMLAFTDGMGVDPEFDAREEQIEKTGQAYNARADAYEIRTGDVETAERVRSMSGWKKYYYMKARAQMHGQGFGAFMDTNKANEEYGVNVGGQVYTLASAPDQATRQAVAAKMASSYMRPYQGLNKSFLGKYMFPGVQKGMATGIANAAAANAKLMKANRLDGALTAFRGSPTPEGMMELDHVLRLDGYDNKTIRGHLTDEMTKVKGNAEFERLMNTPYGPNGQTFQEQYPQEAAELRVKRQQYLQRGVQADEMEMQTADREALLQAKETVIQEKSDGSFDARPERLSELAEQAKAAGLEKTASYWESEISETAFMKNSTQVREQYERQIMAGIVPSKEEILQNPALSMKDKQALLGESKSSKGGGAAPTTELAKGHKSIIQNSIRKRGKWTRDGANDPGVAAMELQAWQKYTATYNRELEDHGNAATAAQEALNEFNKDFADDVNGAYRIGKPGKNLEPGQEGTGLYLGYDRSGNAAVPKNAMSQIDEKLQYMDANTMINTAPDLYEGEEKQLKDLQYTFTTTGKIGSIPPVYYQLQQRYGGNVSIMDMINTRLKANGLDELPKELNDVIKPVEGTFDDETYKYISYKPNATRTDIGLINSGQEPVYSTSLPTSVASDQEFQSAVSATAERLGVSEADLMAVMSFETGGTFNPGIRNAAGSGATGLIQFMPATARGLGTTTEALARMSRVEQMQYVEKYLSNKGVRGGNLSDLYMSVLFPAAVGKPDNFVLFGRGAMSGYTGVAYTQNRGLDKNGDGSVTKAEASAKVMQHRNPNPWRRPNNMRPELQ